MELLPDTEAHLLGILPVLEEIIPPDAADITEKRAPITRSLPLQV